MAYDGKNGGRPTMVVSGAITAAGILVASLLMWTEQKADQVDKYVEAAAATL